MGGPRKGVMVAAVAQLYLGCIMFFAAHAAHTASGSVAVVEPSAKTWWSKLIEGAYIGDYMGDSYRGY